MHWKALLPCCSGHCFKLVATATTSQRRAAPGQKVVCRHHLEVLWPQRRTQRACLRGGPARGGTCQNTLTGYQQGPCACWLSLAALISIGQRSQDLMGFTERRGRGCCRPDLVQQLMVSPAHCGWAQLDLSPRWRVRPFNWKIQGMSVERLCRPSTGTGSRTLAGPDQGEEPQICLNHQAEVSLFVKEND